jgi:hypothetical protein
MNAGYGDVPAPIIYSRGVEDMRPRAATAQDFDLVRSQGYREVRLMIPYALLLFALAGHHLPGGFVLFLQDLIHKK